MSNDWAEIKNQITEVGKEAIIKLVQTATGEQSLTNYLIIDFGGAGIYPEVSKAAVLVGDDLEGQGAEGLPGLRKSKLFSARKGVGPFDGRGVDG